MMVIFFLIFRFSNAVAVEKNVDEDEVSEIRFLIFAGFFTSHIDNLILWSQRCLTFGTILLQLVLVSVYVCACD